MKIAVVIYEHYVYDANNNCVGSEKKEYLTESLTRGRKDNQYYSKRFNTFVRVANDSDIIRLKGTSFLNPKLVQ